MSGHAFFFPGQGSQKVGMGKALFDARPEARAVFEEADDALGFALSRVCFEGPEHLLTLTANTQPAILTTSIAALRVLEAERPELRPTVALGHSLGEFSALVAVGALAFADAVRLVRLRGQAMQEATPVGQGKMAAVIGVDAEVLEGMCADAAQGQVVAPANENGGGQIVVSGHAEAIDRLMDALKAQKKRAIALDVSAPFHCALMQPAAMRLEAALADISVRELQAPVVSNVEGVSYRDSTRVKELLVRQVTSRVRWEASVQGLASMGIRDGLEIGHGKVLTGLVRRIAPELVVRPVGSPTDIDMLREDLHGGN